MDLNHVAKLIKQTDHNLIQWLKSSSQNNYITNVGNKNYTLGFDNDGIILKLYNMYSDFEIDSIRETDCVLLNELLDKVSILFKK